LEAPAAVLFLDCEQVGDHGLAFRLGQDAVHVQRAEQEQRPLMQVDRRRHEPAPLRAGIGVCGSLQLAKDGKTEYVIVTATAASRAEAFAAQELAEYLGRGTKTSWPVVKESAFRGDKPALFVGPAEFARQQGIDVGKLGSEEWIIGAHASRATGQPHVADDSCALPLGRDSGSGRHAHRRHAAQAADHRHPVMTENGDSQRESPAVL
jgi:hypothetical protein